MTDTAIDALVDITDYQADRIVEGHTPWCIDGDREAAWALRKLAIAHAEIERLRVAARAEIDVIEQWLEDALRSPQRSAEFFEGQLVSYRMRLEDNDPTLPNTYKLPGGNIVRRKIPDRIEILDDQALVAWLRSLPDDDPARLALKVTEKPLVSVLRDVVQVVDTDDDGRLIIHDGERVPGVSYDIPGDAYSVKLAEVSA